MSLVGKKLIDRFYIVEALAEGGFGHTYIAEDHSLRTKPKCVLKHLNPIKENLPYLPRIKELFEKEAAILRQLSVYCNQIPRFIDYFEEHGELYLVQEWIDGSTLRQELLPGKKLTQIETLQLVIDILTPLDFCHQEQLIHRDIKPDNILRRKIVGEASLKENRQIIIIDFGMAKDQEKSSGNSLSYGGTPGYAAMEQVRGKPCLASDVYAVGIIAIEALTGMKPQDFQYDEGTLEIDWRPYCHVTDAFADVLSRMVRQIPNRRYQTAAEALKAIPQPTSPTSDLHRTYSFETVTLDKSGKIIKKTPGTAKYLAFDLGNGIFLDIVDVKPGRFIMGSEESDREKPPHLVSVPGFYIGKYAVTQEQYLAIMGKNPSGFQGAKLPVEQVSWDDAQEFCTKLTQKTRKNFRLPSEAEWEYACRAETTTPLSFGETITPHVVNYNNINPYTKAPKNAYRRLKTTPVGKFPPNSFGLYDLHGNVWEWCLDTWHDSYQGAPVNGSPWIETNKNNTQQRLIRGGGWFSPVHHCRSGFRAGRSAGDRHSIIGFRVIFSQDS